MLLNNQDELNSLPDRGSVKGIFQPERKTPSFLDSISPLCGTLLVWKMRLCDLDSYLLDNRKKQYVMLETQDSKHTRKQM